MTSFCLTKNYCWVLILICLCNVGCAGISGQEKWHIDINSRMPIITHINENADSVENKKPSDSLFDFNAPNKALDLSIEQTVMAALKYNRDLSIQRLEPVKIGTFEAIEKAAFDPEFFADAFYTKEDIRITSGSDSEHIITEKTNELELGLGKTFSTGTTVQTDFSHEDSRLEETPAEHSTRIGLTLTQELLNGFGPSVNLARIRQAKLDTALSIHELRAFTETLIANTEIAYWQYVLAKQKIAIFEQSLDIAKKQRDEIEQQITVGLLPQTEAAAARAEVALQEQALINAKSAFEEQRLKLIHVISPGKDDRFGLTIHTTSTPDIETLPITDLSARVRLARKFRPDLAQARLKLEQHKLETVVTKNGRLPKLDFFIALGRTGYGDHFSDAFQNLKNDTLNDVQIGLTLNHLIGNRESEAEHRQAMTSQRQAEIAVENLSQLIDLDVRLAVNEVERTRQQITASRTTREFQEQTSSAEKDRFNVGASTTLLVTQALRDLLVARIAEVEAIVNFRMALVHLFLAEGSLLDMRGIGIDTDSF